MFLFRIRTRFNCIAIFIFILLSAVSCIKPAGIQIRPDEESILFIRTSNDFQELAVMRPDGTIIKTILRYKEAKGLYQDRIDAARWSPDKSRIVLEGGPDVMRGIVTIIPLWIIDNNGKLIRKLTPNGYRPVWSNDGKKIFYVKHGGNYGSPHNAYSINADGTNEQLVYHSGDSISFHLTDVSVSGIYIYGYETLLVNPATGMLTQYNPEIVRIDLKTGEKTFLTNNDLSDAAPRLSHDGNKIAYYHQESEGRSSIQKISNVYIMNTDGQSSQNITNFTNLNLSYPFIAWSPDGNFLGFNKADQLNRSNSIGDIFKVDINTGEIIQLTNTTTVNEMIMDWK